MSIEIPEGQPNRRFMRYVRPPEPAPRQVEPPLFPIVPATRKLRVGIDTETLPDLPEGYLLPLLQRDEISAELITTREREVPRPWMDALGADALVHSLDFTSVDDAGRFADSVEFWVDSKGPECESSAAVHFFDLYQHLDAANRPGGAQPLPIELLHRAAAHAAAARVVGLDAIITASPTAGRSDVADNDVVTSVTPGEAVALLGHYLRVTANPVIAIRQGNVVGGTWQETTTTGSVTALYREGVLSGMTFFDCLEPIAAKEGAPRVVSMCHAVQVRLIRATKAFDTLLAALSNPLKGNRGQDVIETAAEAFDRELLYLSAVYDILGRGFCVLKDLTAAKPAQQSLDSELFVQKHLEPVYRAEALVEVKRLQKYAWVCKQLRNHIHDGVLAIGPSLGRVYGSDQNLAINLDQVPKMDTESSGLSQEHYDALGVWRGQPHVLGPTVTVADLPTAGFTLLRAGLEYVEVFAKLLLTSKPSGLPNASSLFGCVEIPEGFGPLPTPPTAAYHRALFGWHPEVPNAF
ncbi:hypothetical protein [Gordonia sp. 852002-51296_SCH5728562-b]|uniref:hypothetical protein n=1 Tax=Gordonia sp. 852002-51296_SCH5728562-b TaxID=1834101 RepID=UPI0012E748C6|nr:hypothetical protein [Gordonia sp. 852002-51296_SCH5728562-b]